MAAIPDIPPGTLTSFGGHRIEIAAGFEEDRVSGGVNNGRLQDYLLLNLQSQGGFDYRSVGGGGAWDSYLWDPLSLQRADNAVFGSDYLWKFDGLQPDRPPSSDSAPATRSELRVDNLNAFLPGTLDGGFADMSTLDPLQLAGFPAVTWSHSVDPATGDLAITESEEAVECAPSATTFPPTATSCTRFVPAGVRIDRTIVQSHNGLLALIRDRWSSTNGAPHQLDLELENDSSSGASNTNDLAYLLPWASSAFQVYHVGDPMPPPPAGAGRLYVHTSRAGTDGDKAHSFGVVSYASAPQGLRVIFDSTQGSNGSSFVAHYAATVPASGVYALAFGYGHAFRLADAAALGNDAEAAFRPKSVTVNQPPVSFRKNVKITGSAADDAGIAAVSVNGHTGSVASDGSWSAVVPLGAGHNALTAVVTNVYGITAQAQGQAIYEKVALAGRPKIKGSAVVLKVRCPAVGGVSCPGSAQLASTERLRGSKVLGVSAKKRKLRHKRVVVGSKRFRAKSGKTITVKVPLNRRGRKLLGRFHKLPVRLTVSVGPRSASARVGKPRKLVFHKRRLGG